MCIDQIPEFVDERQKGWCVHCRQWIVDLNTNRDHVPSKGLLRRPYPANLPAIPVCKKCNEGFSADEEYFAAFLGCVLAGSTELQRQVNPRLATTLRRSPALRARIEACRTESPTLFGNTRIVWTPEKDRIHRVIVKNARGHAFFEYGEPMLNEPNYVGYAPIEFLRPEERELFESVRGGPLWPEVGSRMLTRVLTGQDLVDGWVVVQEGVYRYAVTQEDPLVVRSVINEYLATEVSWSD